MTKRCVGCGANFQSYDINKPGFIKEDLKEKKDICERCYFYVIFLRLIVV